MKKILPVALLLFVITIPLTAQVRKSVLSVLPALQQLVNAETGENGIPWDRKEAQCDVQLKARLMSEITLVSTEKGKYTYTLHKLVFMVEQAMQGTFDKDALMFYIERQSPAPGSHIKMKELWPFARDKSLTFRLRKVGQQYLIVSIEP